MEKILIDKNQGLGSKFEMRFVEPGGDKWGNGSGASPVFGLVSFGGEGGVAGACPRRGGRGVLAAAVCVGVAICEADTQRRRVFS